MVCVMFSALTADAAVPATNAAATPTAPVVVTVVPVIGLVP